MKTKKILTLSKMKKDENDVNQQKEERHQYRVKILQKIEELEREGKFDVDAENDPPSIELTPENVDYLKAKRTNKSQLLKYIMRKSQALPAWDFFAQKRGFLNIGRIPYNK